MAPQKNQPLKTYQSIEARILEPVSSGEHYPVEISVLGGPDFRGILRLDLNALESLLLEPHNYGKALGEMLFSEEALGDAYRQSLSAALAAGKGLRVHLQIDPLPLRKLRWERLYHPVEGAWRPLGSTPETPFSRFVPAERWDRPRPIIQRPLRMLAIIASPENLRDYNLDSIPMTERQSLREILGGLPDIAVTYLESGTINPPTLIQTRRLLAQGFHMVHILCHGVVTPGGTVLYLEDDAGAVAPIQTDRIVRIFDMLRNTPQFCFLAACETAAQSRQDAFPSMGEALVKEGGVQAVVAMTDKVGVNTARLFTEHFYQRLFDHNLVDVAVNQGRAFIHDEWDWGVPVLFSRLPGNQLFSVDPVRTALEAIRQWRKGEYLPMPIEVSHLVRHPDPQKVEWIQQESTPSSNLIEALLGIFAGEDQADQSSGTRKRTFVVLVGSHGSARSTQIHQIARLTAEYALHPDARRTTIPVYVDLKGLPSIRSGTRNRIETLMLESLQTFWPDLTAAELAELLEGDGRHTLRVLIDGSDDLEDRHRNEAWREVRSLVKDHPSHEYLLAVDHDSFDPWRLKDASDVLILQPLSRANIQQFLVGLKDPVGLRLYRELEKTQLFDLASSPFLMVQMLSQAQQGIYPSSRSQVLKNLVEDALTELPTDRGMRSRAEQTLYALAWEMQSGLSSTWDVKSAFQTMETIRGNREFGLEDLYQSLAKNDLLVKVGQDSMRFAYPSVQAYCCAKAILQLEERDRALDDITASLGRLSRLRWWEDTLVLLSGIMSNPNVLYRLIVYGSNLLEGEQVYLLVRCLMESGQQGVDAELIDQVIDALVWRLDDRNEPRSDQRLRAVQALGQLRHPAGIPFLARVANQRVRTGWDGMPKYEYSPMRMAATLALKGMMPRYEKRIYEADEELAELLRLWQKEDVGELHGWLISGDQGIKAIASFALGDLQTDEAIEILVSAFLDPEIPADTRWAVTDALVMLDASEVTERIIRPLLDEDAARKAGLYNEETWKRRSVLYVRLAYLIGKLQVTDPVANEFLSDCMDRYAGVKLKARAITSLGWLRAWNRRNLFEEVALGNFDSIQDEFKLGKPFPNDLIYLRRKAIEALAYIGDQDTITRLRTRRKDWAPELMRAYYLMQEEISSRLQKSVRGM